VGLTFTQSVADVFGVEPFAGRPSAAMLYEGDFVVAEINKLNKVGGKDRRKGRFPVREQEPRPFRIPR
jgi:hypothetical protein